MERAILKPFVPLVVFVLFAGCSISIKPWSGENTNPRYVEFGPGFLGGFHPRFEEETLHLTWYALNTREDWYPGTFNVTADVRVTLKNVKDPVDTQGDSIYFYDPVWRAGDVRQIEYRFDVDPHGTYSVGLDLSPGINYYYSSCFDAGGFIVERYASCNVSPLAAYTTDTEPFYYEDLLACCGWLPPLVAGLEPACVPGAGGLECSVTAWNWHNATADYEGEVLVQAVHADGARTNLSRGEVPNDTLAAGEEKRVTVAMDLPGGLDADASDVVIVVRLWRPDLPKSLHTAEAPYVPALPIQ